MPCYNPAIGKFVGFKPNGKPAYEWTPAPSKSEKRNFKLAPNDIYINCKQCTSCRLSRSREWADRMLLEFDHTKKALFLTMTYDPEFAHYVGDFDPNAPEKEISTFNLPNGKDVFVASYSGRRLTYDYSDLRLFWKCLRRKFPTTEIRYYGSSEYGPATHRPHFHFILFGLSLDDITDKQFYKTDKFGYPLFTSAFFENSWKRGFCVIADANYYTMAYVARYVTKKYNNDYDIDSQLGLKPPDNWMSTRPGLGAYYLLDHPETTFDSTQLVVPNKPLTRPDGTIDFHNTVDLPRYLADKLGETDPVRYSDFLKARCKLADDKLLLHLKNVGLDYYHESLERESIRILNMTPRDSLSDSDLSFYQSSHNLYCAKRTKEEN